MQITKVKTWADDSVSPQSVELLADGFSVYEGPDDEISNSFIDGFICALESLSHDYEFAVEDIFD